MSKQQHKHFEEMNSRLGLPTDYGSEYRNMQAPQQGKDEIVISSIPGESDLPVMLIPIGSIAELNAAIGMPDSGNDSHVHYPAPLPYEQLNLVNTARSKAELMGSLPISSIQAINDAANAYLLGDPKKTAAYEELINATLFPGQIAYVSGEELVIPDNNSLILKGPDPLVLNYKNIELGNDAKIVMKGSGMLIAQQIGKTGGLSSTSEGDIVIDCYGEDYTTAAGKGRDGGDGSQGPKGNDGKTSYNGGTCTYDCQTEAENGQTGGDGGTGGKGVRGSDGRPPSKMVFLLGDIKGNLTVNARGGKGQKGGKGGTGGPGGPGGPGGSKPDQCKKTAKAGDQGPGGKGGDGGDGGTGGDGGIILVQYKSITGQIFPSNPIKAEGGDPGDPGDPGPGGNGKNLGKGNPGNRGNPGTLPKITIEKV